MSATGLLAQSGRPEFDSCIHHGCFPRSSHTSDLHIGALVDVLPGAWLCRISAGVGWPCVSILWLGEIESLIGNFYHSVAACTIVLADLFVRYASIL